MDLDKQPLPFALFKHQRHTYGKRGAWPPADARTTPSAATQATGPAADMEVQVK